MVKESDGEDGEREERNDDEDNEGERQRKIVKFAEEERKSIIHQNIMNIKNYRSLELQINGYEYKFSI